MRIASLLLLAIALPLSGQDDGHRPPADPAGDACTLTRTLRLEDGLAVQSHVTISKALFDREAASVVRQVTAFHVISRDGEPRGTMILPELKEVATASATSGRMTIGGDFDLRITVQPRDGLTWGEVWDLNDLRVSAE